MIIDLIWHTKLQIIQKERRGGAQNSLEILCLKVEEEGRRLAVARGFTTNRLSSLLLLLLFCI